MKSFWHYIRAGIFLKYSRSFGNLPGPWNQFVRPQFADTIISKNKETYNFFYFKLNLRLQVFGHYPWDGHLAQNLLLEVEAYQICAQIETKHMWETCTESSFLIVLISNCAHFQLCSAFMNILRNSRIPGSEPILLDLEKLFLLSDSMESSGKTKFFGKNDVLKFWKNILISLLIP